MGLGKSMIKLQLSTGLDKGWKCGKATVPHEFDKEAMVPHVIGWRSHGSTCDWIKKVFLTEYWRIAWILEDKELAWEKCVWGGSSPSQALPPLTPQKGSSRDPAAMEKTCAKSTPYSVKTWHSRVSGQQSENIVLTHGQSITTFNNIFTSVFMQCWHLYIIVVFFPGK